MNPIKINKLTVSSDQIPLENVVIEKHSDGVPNILGDNQINLHCSEGTYITTIEQILIIEFSPVNKIPKDCIKAKRISVQSELTYSPITIIPKDKYREYNIPDIYGEDQFVFISERDKRVMIINEESINLIEI